MTILVFRLKPSRHLDVVEPEYDKRRLARDGHDWHDRRRRAREASKGKFVQADTVEVVQAGRIACPTNGMGAQQGDY
jgi:hypothetical protein